MIAGKEKIAKYFEDLLDKYGDDYRSLDWKSIESRDIRFYVLLDMIASIPKQDKISILEVGCGLGHFYDFLKNNGFLESFGITYSGIDISHKLIDFAKKKNPIVDFDVVDLLNDNYTTTHDIVIAAGTFNIRMSEVAEHKATIVKMLSKMNKLSRYGTAVSFLARPANYVDKDEEHKKESRYVYFTEEEAIKWAKDLCERYVIRRDYHPGDFAVYMLK